MTIDKNACPHDDWIILRMALRGYEITTASGATISVKRMPYMKCLRCSKWGPIPRTWNANNHYGTIAELDAGVLDVRLHHSHAPAR